MIVHDGFSPKTMAWKATHIEPCRCGLSAGISSLGRPGFGALGGAKARQARDLIDGTGGWVGLNLSQPVDGAQHV